MALIKCPECGKEISDKAPVCIHCGCPLQEPKNTKCIINGKEYDLGFLLDDSDPNYSIAYKVKDFYKLTNCDRLGDATEIVKQIISSQSIPKALRVKAKSVLSQYNYTPEDNRPRCPHCNSTNIQSIGTGERIGSIMMFGMFSKKMNKSFKCLDCKYTW